MREPSSWSERGPCLHIVMVWCDDSAGVVEQGKGTEGSPGTWEILSSPWKKSRAGTPGNKTPGPSLGIRRRREARNEPNAPVVSPSEGNEVRRDGRQEVVASR